MARHIERNYKTLLKDIKEVLNKWKNITNPWAGCLYIAKLSYLPNSIYKFSGIQIKELI